MGGSVCMRASLTRKPVIRNAAGSPGLCRGPWPCGITPLRVHAGSRPDSISRRTRVEPERTEDSRASHAGRRVLPRRPPGPAHAHDRALARRRAPTGARCGAATRQGTQQEWEQVQVQGDIAYLQAGPADAPAVVFLHGIGGAARGFLPQLDGLRDAYRVIAWDMPGHGASTPLEPVTLDALTAGLAGFLQALGLDRPVLAGHSLGGMLVLRLLSVRPDIARAAILAQTSAAFGSRDPAWAEDFIRTRLAPLDAGRKPWATWPRTWWPAWPGTTRTRTAWPWRGTAWPARPDIAYRDAVLAMPGFDQRDTLPGLSLPVLVLAGTEDQQAPATAMERMAGRISRAHASRRCRGPGIWRTWNSRTPSTRRSGGSWMRCPDRRPCRGRAAWTWPVLNAWLRCLDAVRPSARPFRAGLPLRGRARAFMGRRGGCCRLD